MSVFFTQVQNIHRLNAANKKSTVCKNSELLFSILTYLLGILDKDPKRGPDRVNEVLDTINEYLSQSSQSLKNNELLYKYQAFDDQLQKDKEITHTDVKKIRSHFVHTMNSDLKTVPTHEFPSLKKPNCRQAYLKLIQVAKDALMQLSQSSICEDSSLTNMLSTDNYFNTVPQNVMGIKDVASNDDNDISNNDHENRQVIFFVMYKIISKMLI